MTGILGHRPTHITTCIDIHINVTLPECYHITVIRVAEIYQRYNDSTSTRRHTPENGDLLRSNSPRYVF